jgi:hypothetical protein
MKNLKTFLIAIGLFFGFSKNVICQEDCTFNSVKAKINVLL